MAQEAHISGTLTYADTTDFNKVRDLLIELDFVYKSDTIDDFVWTDSALQAFFPDTNVITIPGDTYTNLSTHRSDMLVDTASGISPSGSLNISFDDQDYAFAYNNGVVVELHKDDVFKSEDLPDELAQQLANLPDEEDMDSVQGIATEIASMLSDDQTDSAVTNLKEKFGYDLMSNAKCSNINGTDITISVKMKI